MWRLGVVLAVAAGLGGCVSGPALDYIKAEYTGTDAVLHQVGDDEYRIFDKPSAGRMMITPSLSRTVGMGIATGHGAPDQSHFVGPYRTVGVSYLRETNRSHCRVTSAELLMKPQYEVKYDCGAPAAVSPSASAAPARRR